LICNTFNNWNTNILGAVQMACTALPNGTECTTYSANIFTVEGGTPPFTWSVSGGSLPPGLTMSPTDGSITGMGGVGTFTFTVMVTDSSSPPLSAAQDQTITITPCAAPPTTTPPTEPPTAAPTTTPSVAPTEAGTLPATGSSSGAPLYVGIVLFVLGAFVVTVTTRRRANRS
jgi:LPXTG-motif cell wall-anchored protein